VKASARTLDERTFRTVVDSAGFPVVSHHDGTFTVDVYGDRAVHTAAAVRVELTREEAEALHARLGRMLGLFP
jgi:hypothetical protein